jgi:hypothetical protein
MLKEVGKKTFTIAAEVYTWDKIRCWYRKSENFHSILYNGLSDFPVISVSQGRR